MYRGAPNFWFPGTKYNPYIVRRSYLALFPKPTLAKCLAPIPALRITNNKHVPDLRDVSQRSSPGAEYVLIMIIIIPQGEQGEEPPAVVLCITP